MIRIKNTTQNILCFTLYNSMCYYEISTIIDNVIIKNSMYKTFLSFTCANCLPNYRLLNVQNASRRLSVAVIILHLWDSGGIAYTLCMLKGL